MVKLTEAPPIAEATAKPARPVMNITLRPIRSASRPQNSSRLPNDSEYAVTIHCLSTLLKCSACWADGSAMFITVRSRTTMSCAMRDDDQDQPAPRVGTRLRARSLSDMKPAIWRLRSG